MTLIDHKTERHGASRERNGASHRRCCASVIPLKPAASAVPLTGKPPRELAEIDTDHVSRKALAAGLPPVTDRIVEMIGELSQ